METLLEHLPSPELIDCLIEPFIGSVSVFLNTHYRQYVLADSNADLIDTYRHASKNPTALTKTQHRLYWDSNSDAAYQDYRGLFNELGPCIEKSALFIYLNRQGFNGMCRYNKKGKFNVPFWCIARLFLPEKEIGIFARKAARCHVSFFRSDFSETIKVATTGMFASMRYGIYCDPPYLPLSETSDFTAYDGH